MSEGHTLQTAYKVADSGKKVFCYFPWGEWVGAWVDQRSESKALKWIRNEIKVPYTIHTKCGWAIEGCESGEDGLACEFCQSCPHLDNEPAPAFVDVPLDVWSHSGTVAFLRVSGGNQDLPQGRIMPGESAASLTGKLGFVRFVWPEWVTAPDNIPANVPKVYCNESGSWLRPPRDEYIIGVRPIAARFEQIEEGRDGRNRE